MTVLIVDDDRFLLDLVRRQLALIGIDRVRACERAEEALALLADEPDAYDVLICDLNMPGMDGVEFLRDLARDGFAGGLVLLSGEDERILQTAETLARAHEFTVLAALSKPVAPEQLREALDRWPPVHAGASAGRQAKVYGAAIVHQAIAAGELVVFYQPKIDAATGTLAGVEALVRWQHADDGLVSPDRFLGVAERFGLMGDVTRAVLTAALRQLRHWQDEGLDLRLGVNISLDSFATVDLPDAVAEVVREAGVDPRCLVLEVTERQIMEDRRALLDIAARLRLKRIGLSIDDFGVGRASLAQLRDLPFDELKLDRSFVHGASRNTSLRAIVTAHVQLAHDLGITVVAEGVEDRDDWDFVRGVGCDLIQGHFVSEALPADALSLWLARWETRRRLLFPSPA